MSPVNESDFDPQSRKNVVLLEESLAVESPTAVAMRQMSGMASWSAGTRPPGTSQGSNFGPLSR